MHTNYNTYIHMIHTAEEIKNNLRQRFSEIVFQSEEYFEEECGCGSGCGCSSGNDSTDTEAPGYHPYADLGLGTGNPTRYAGIKQGEVVIDLGSGAGMDSFLARELTGATGKVIGIDMTERMVQKARQNADLAGYNNVEFRMGEAENIPATDKSAHVVIANGLISLIPDKQKAISEIYRVLKHHGRVVVSDMMIRGCMPRGLKQDAEMYAGCLAGTNTVEEYMEMFRERGFEEITLCVERKFELPDAMLHYYLPPEEASGFRDGVPGLYSITLSAEKPCCHAGEEDHVCCGNH